MPRTVVITFKKTSKLEVRATFSDEQWASLRDDWQQVGTYKGAPTKGFYRCIVEENGPEESEILLDLNEIIAIV